MEEYVNFQRRHLGHGLCGMHKLFLTNFLSTMTVSHVEVDTFH